MGEGTCRNDQLFQKGEGLAAPEVWLHQTSMAVCPGSPAGALGPCCMQASTKQMTMQGWCS